QLEIKKNNGVHGYCQVSYEKLYTCGLSLIDIRFPCRELQALPDNVHILCPRQNDDDHGQYDDPTQVDESGRNAGELVAEATARKEKFLSCMRILAYNEEGVAELQ